MLFIAIASSRSSSACITCHRTVRGVVNDMEPDDSLCWGPASFVARGDPCVEVRTTAVPDPHSVREPQVRPAGAGLAPPFRGCAGPADYLQQPARLLPGSLLRARCAAPRFVLPLSRRHTCEARQMSSAERTTRISVRKRGGPSVPTASVRRARSRP
jgi:hypothetical protein